MNNVNVSFEIENSIKNFLVNERKNIINIRNVENNYRINFMSFKKNEIYKTFNGFCYNNINKHNKYCIHIFVIVVL